MLNAIRRVGEHIAMVSILQSKLLQPDVSRAVLRERLDSLLREIPQKKLTVIVGGAGFGKTTLVSQFFSDTNHDVVWYRLGEPDRDLTTFLGYLVYGLKSTCRSLVLDVPEEVVRAGGSWAECERALTALMAEIDGSITRDLFVVLDDFHRVQKSKEITQALDFMLEFLPPRIHFAITSRSKPRLSLSRLRSAGEVLEIDSEGLSFTASETAKLAQDLFRISLAPGDLEQLQRKTQGWAAGLALVFHGLKGKSASAVADCVEDLSGSPEMITD